MAKNKASPGAFGYVRVADIFDLKGIGQQSTQIHEYCIAQGIELKALFVERGDHGANFQGPAWKELERLLKGSFKGKISKVVASEGSELAGDTGLYLLKKYELRTSLGVTIEYAGGRQMEQGKGFSLN
jgi:hypothetical protein